MVKVTLKTTLTSSQNRKLRCKRKATTAKLVCSVAERKKRHQETDGGEVRDA